MAMKVVRQARLELSGGSTPDQLRPNALNHSRPARPCSFPLSCAVQTGLRLHALEGSRRRGARGVRIVGVYQGPSATSPRTRAPDLGDFKGTLFGGVLMEDLLR